MFWTPDPGPPAAPIKRQECGPHRALVTRVQRWRVHRAPAPGAAERVGLGSLALHRLLRLAVRGGLSLDHAAAPRAPAGSTNSMSCEAAARTSSSWKRPNRRRPSAAAPSMSGIRSRAARRQPHPQQSERTSVTAAPSTLVGILDGPPGSLTALHYPRQPPSPPRSRTLDPSEQSHSCLGTIDDEPWRHTTPDSHDLSHRHKTSLRSSRLQRRLPRTGTPHQAHARTRRPPRRRQGSETHDCWRSRLPGVRWGHATTADAGKRWTPSGQVSADF